jgi:transcriptional regulator with XRE-family HTH domain
LYNQILLTNILRILEELGVTKKELAERANISLSFLSDLTNDKANPSLRIMEAIADALETPLPVLLELTNLNKEDLNKLMAGKPKTSLPEGFSRVCAILNEYQAYQVRQWDAENKKYLPTGKRGKTKK